MVGSQAQRKQQAKDREQETKELRAAAAIEERRLCMGIGDAAGLGGGCRLHACDHIRTPRLRRPSWSAMGTKSQLIRALRLDSGGSFWRPKTLRPELKC